MLYMTQEEGLILLLKIFFLISVLKRSFICCYFIILRPLESLEIIVELIKKNIFLIGVVKLWFQSCK